MPAGGGTVRKRTRALKKVKLGKGVIAPKPKPAVPQKPGYNVPVKGQAKKIAAAAPQRKAQRIAMRRSDRQRAAQRQKIKRLGGTGGKDYAAAKRAEQADSRLVKALKAVTPDSVERELAGRGKLASASHDAADFLAKGVKQYVESGGLSSTAQPVTSPKVRAKKGKKLPGATIQTGARLGTTSGPAKAPKILLNAVRNAVELPAQAVPSVAIPAVAVSEAVQGNPRRLKKLAKDYEKTGVIPPLVKGNIKEAAKRAEKNPVYAALELSGGKAAVGRGIGAVGRGARIKAAGTKREPLRLHPEGMAGPVVKRSHSKDVINKAATVALEKRAKKGGKVSSKLLRVERGKSTVASKARARKELQRRVDDEVVVSMGKLKVNRKRAALETERDVPAKHAFAAQLATEGVIRKGSVKADLEKYLGTVRKASEEKLTKREAAGNRETQKQIRKLLKDPEFLRDPSPVFESAAKFTKAQEKRDVESTDLGLLADPETRAKVVPAAVQHLGAKFDKKSGKFKVGGELLNLRELEGKLREQGIAPGFVSQRPFQKGARNYYRGLKERPTVAVKRRTGEATRRGTAERGQEPMIEQAVRSTVLNTSAKNFDRTIKEFAVKVPERVDGEHKGGKWVKNYDDAQTTADEITQTTGREFVPVNIAKFNERTSRLKEIHKNLEDTGVMDEGVVEQLSDALKDSFARPPDGRGRFALIDKAVADRIKAHNQPSTPLGKATQMIGGAWVKNVLAFSPKWIPGNIIDLGLRSVINGLTPVDFLRSRNVVKELRKTNPEAASALVERAIGGTMYAQIQKGTRFRNAEQLIGSGLEDVAAGGAAALRAPGVRTLRRLYNGWVQTMFGFEQLLEITATKAALGKHARREIAEVRGPMTQFLRASSKGLEEFANGLADTSAQTKAARYVEEVFGRWGKMGPTSRHFLIHYAPFAQWLRVASKFVFITLPAKHPIKTAVLAGLTEMSEEERKAMGLSLFAKDRKPDFLQGSIVNDKGETIRLQGFTSFGVTSGFPGSFADSILPQFSGTLQNWQGLDWRGHELRYEDGHTPDALERFGIGLYTMGEGFIPLISHIRRAREGGATSRPESTFFNPKTKEGKKSPGNYINRVFNPFRPISGLSPTGPTKVHPLDPRKQFEQFKKSQSKQPTVDPRAAFEAFKAQQGR